MKAVVINQYGGKEELVEQEVNKPNAQANQVVLKLEATWSVYTYLDRKIKVTYT